jgi:hypothetical protein
LVVLLKFYNSYGLVIGSGAAIIMMRLSGGIAYGRPRLTAEWIGRVGLNVFVDHGEEALVAAVVELGDEDGAIQARLHPAIHRRLSLRGLHRRLLALRGVGFLSGTSFSAQVIACRIYPDLR